MSSYPSFAAVTAKIMSNGRMTRPGETVENKGKNCKIAIRAKKLERKNNGYSAG
jgi:hypothetical protein